jgi:AraC family L-rhamnose operon regulatory protein RhaS
MPIPLYQESGKTYRADTCQPVEHAIAAATIQHAAMVHGHYPGRRLPRTALPGLKTVGYWDAEFPQPWGLDWHRNEGIEWTFLERGSLGFAVDHAQYRLRADDLTVTRPWQQHRVGNPHVEAGRLHWIILDVGVRRPHQAWHWPPWIVLAPKDLRELTDVLRFNEQPVWHASGELRHCFQRIAGTVERDRDGSGVSMLAALLNEFFVLTLDLFRRRDVALDQSLVTSQRTVELFWADLAEHEAYLAAEWTVRSMAQRCGLGVTQFIHLTKRLFNMTPSQHLNLCRLNAAARRLRKTPAENIAAIAKACGFASAQYFSTQFRRSFQCRPSEYRGEGKSRDERSARSIIDPSQ